MKIKKLFVLLFLIAVACSSEDMNKTEEANETEEVYCSDEDVLEDVSGLIPKENLPEWLSDIVNEFEDMYSNDNIATLTIHKGIWCEKVVYVIYDMYSSCLLCEVYDICGNNIADSEEFIYTWPKNLVLIYKVGIL